MTLISIALPTKIDAAEDPTDFNVICDMCKSEVQNLLNDIGSDKSEVIIFKYI